MGTQSAPNIILPIIDFATGNPETNLNIKLLKYGGTLGNSADEYELTEIGSSGRYVYSEAVGVDAVPQDVYSVYVEVGGGYQLKGVYLHGGEMIKTHALQSNNPHNVTAVQLAVTDSGTFYTGNNAESILQEIGSKLDTKADIDNTLLLNDTSQSVVAAKPKVTNLDVDKVDGKHANNSPNELMILDDAGLVPLNKIPDILTGKDASSVSGKVPGDGNNNLSIISDNQANGKLDVSLLGKATGAGGGLDADTVDGQHASAFATKTGTGASGTWGINVTGNAATATKLATARTLSLTGDVTGSVSFDGSANASITATVANNSHNHTVSTITDFNTTVDAKIQAVVGAAPAALDTLAEIATQLANDESAVSALTTVVSTKLPSASYTASDVLTKIKTVDGSGSGLDADLLDGKQAYDLDNVRTSSANRALDDPPADLHGGGTIWFDKHTGTASVSTIVDNSIDWRDRWVVVEGYIRNNATTYQPGTAVDNDITAGVNHSAYLVHACFYTEDGGTTPKCYIYQSGNYSDHAYLWVNAEGHLMVYNHYVNGNISMGLKISYSPEQNHY